MSIHSETCDVIVSKKKQPVVIYESESDVENDSSAPESDESENESDKSDNDDDDDDNESFKDCESECNDICPTTKIGEDVVVMEVISIESLHTQLQSTVATCRQLEQTVTTLSAKQDEIIELYSQQLLQTRFKLTPIQVLPIINKYVSPSICFDEHLKNVELPIDDVIFILFENKNVDYICYQLCARLFSHTVCPLLALVNQKNVLFMYNSPPIIDNDDDASPSASKYQPVYNPLLISHCNYLISSSNYQQHMLTDKGKSVASYTDYSTEHYRWMQLDLRTLKKIVNKIFIICQTSFQHWKDNNKHQITHNNKLSIIQNKIRNNIMKINESNDTILTKVLKIIYKQNKQTIYDIITNGSK